MSAAAALKPVLIVEDDVDIREVLREQLAAQGYPVSVAGHGKEAMDVLDSHPAPGLIVLDMMMPVMNGVEFIEKMLANPAYRDLPVVVISAGNKVPSIARAFFRKPFEIRKLLDVVRQHCG